MPNAHERFPGAVGEHRDWPSCMVFYDAEIVAVGVDWPWFDIGETVSGGEPHGVLDFRVVPHLDSRIVPPVKPVADVAAVVQHDPLLEQRGMRPQYQFYRPLHSVHAIDVSHLNIGTAIRSFPEGE